MVQTKGVTYSKSAELASSALLVDGSDLRQLAGNAESCCACLQVAQCLHVEHIFGEEGTDSSSKGGNENRGIARPSTVVQYQDRDDDVLTKDQSSLAVCAEWESVSEVVGQRDQVGARLEEVGEERHASSRLGVEELENLGDLDDGRGGDDANSQAFADGELEAIHILEVHIEEQRLVAGLADDGHSKVADGRREVVGDGLDGGAKHIHPGRLFGKNGRCGLEGGWVIGREILGIASVWRICGG